MTYLLVFIKLVVSPPAAPTSPCSGDESITLVVQLREVQISICQIVAEIEVEAEQETVNKLLKKEQRDWSNVGIDTQPGVDHKNMNQDFLNLVSKIQTLPPSLHHSIFHRNI